MPFSPPYSLLEVLILLTLGVRWASWAADAAEEPEGAAASADRYAQEAIDALNGTTP
jgi:hypothetical protein